MQKTLYGLFVLLSLAITGYAAVTYLLYPLGFFLPAKMTATYNDHALSVYIHIFSACVALILGPFQFSTSLRRRYTAMHRISGRLYLGVGVLLGGLSGLYIAQFAFGGLLSKSGFSLLAIIWVASGAMAFRAILAGDIAAHKTWMIRNMALTFAAVTLRLYLILCSSFGWQFETYYPWLGWACWIPNLIIAEIVFNSRTQKTYSPSTLSKDDHKPVHHEKKQPSSKTRSESALHKKIG